MPNEEKETIYNGQDIIFKIEEYMKKRKRTGVYESDLCVMLEKCIQ